MSVPDTGTPGGSAPALVVSPSDTIRGNESAIERATREAQERVHAGQPALVSHPSQTQARTEGGQFSAQQPSDRVAEVGAGAPGSAEAAATAAPAAGQAGERQQPPQEGEQAPPASSEVVEGDDEAVEETPEQKVERERAERIVPITGRNNVEFELELPEGTPREVVDAVRHLRNSAMRADEIRAARAEIEQRGEQLAQAQSEIELDPTGYLLAVANENPVVALGDGTEVPLVDHMVLHLLTQPKVFDRLRERVEAILADERELRTVRAETQAQRASIREEMREVAEERAAVSRNLQDVQGTVAAMLPTTMSEAQQQVLYRDCLRDLKDYADRNRFRTIPVKDIPAILATRLTAYGINPVEAAARAAESATRRANAPARRPAASAGQGGAAPASGQQPPKTGQRFVASAKKKGEVAAIPPGGAGSPAQPSALTPPRKPDGSKMSLEETFAWQREQMKKGVRRFG